MFSVLLSILKLVDFSFSRLCYTSYTGNFYSKQVCFLIFKPLKSLMNEIFRFRRISQILSQKLSPCIVNII